MQRLSRFLVGVGVYLVVFASPSPKGIGTARCEAAELPSVAELRQDSSAIQEMSSNVQGSIRVFRSETVNRAAFDKPPSELGIPLSLSGEFWRSEGRFRANYTLFWPDQSRIQCAVAEGDGEVYELVSGADPNAGMLNVYDDNTPEAATAKEFIRKTFWEPLDSLWGHNGIAFVDLLQRPGTQVETSQRFPGGYALVLSGDDGVHEQFQFKSGKYHPFGYSLAAQEVADLRVKAERQVISIEKEGALYPSQVVDVVSLGKDSGYTLVVMLDLEPLQADSPIAEPFVSASFRDLGVGYQVYRTHQSGGEQIAERFDTPDDLPRASGSTFRPRASGSTFRTYCLWLNGAVILGLIACVVYLIIRRKKVRD